MTTSRALGAILLLAASVAGCGRLGGEPAANASAQAEANAAAPAVPGKAAPVAATPLARPAGLPRTTHAADPAMRPTLKITYSILRADAQ